MDYEELCPVGTKVRLIIPTDSPERGWMVVPLHAGNKKISLPDGYELDDGWGIVTKHDTDSSRSFGGKQPIVVQDYIYCEFNKDVWEAYS